MRAETIREPGPPGPRRRRIYAAGLAIAAIYLLVAGASFSGGLLPRAPVLDGLGPPPPYQWVNPPPSRVKDNKPPGAATQSITASSNGYPGSVTTPDGQCQVLLDATSLPVVPGQGSVAFTMTPLDPASVGPPPAGFNFDSNAYRITGSYQPSGQALTTLNATIVLTYATSADRVIQWTGSSWKSLDSIPSGNNQLYVSATSLGIFATAVLGGGSGAGPKQQSSTTLVLEILPFFFVVLAVLAVVLLRVRRRRGPRGSGPSAGSGRGGAPRR